MTAEEYVGQNDGVERFALMWAAELKNKDNGQFDGVFYGFIVIPSEESAQERYERLKTAGIMQQFIRPENVLLLKGKDGILSSRNLSQVDWFTLQTPEAPVQTLEVVDLSKSLAMTDQPDPPAIDPV
jgi:hypothetical protein